MLRFRFTCRRHALNDVQNPHDNETLQRQIAATDSQIDRLVYELYDLKEEEIKIVEGSE